MTEQQSTSTAEQQTQNDPQQTSSTPAAPPLPSTAARSANGQPAFSQADLDRIVQTRLAEQQTQHERALAEAEERAGKSELDAARLDIDKYKQLAEAAEKTANETILAERVTALVADSDVKKDRRARLAAMISRDGLAALPPDEQREKVTAQITALLDEMPEWKASSVPGSAGGPTKAPGTSSVTLDQFRGMNPIERGELHAKSADEYAALVQQEAQSAWR